VNYSVVKTSLVTLEVQN